MADLQSQIDTLFDLVQELLNWHLLSSVLGNAQAIDRFHDEFLPGVDPTDRVDADDPNLEEQLRSLVISIHADAHTIRDVDGITVTQNNSDIVFDVGTDNVEA